MSRHNVTVQFPQRVNYDRLRALSRLWDEPLGEIIAKLVDEDIKKRGIVFEGEGHKRRVFAK